MCRLGKRDGGKASDAVAFPKLTAHDNGCRQLVPLLNQVIQLLALEATLEAAVLVLVELVTHRGNARFEDTICRGLLPVITTGCLHETLNRAFAGAHDACCGKMPDVYCSPLAAWQRRMRRPCEQ